jgi:hypothetical protein
LSYYKSLCRVISEIQKEKEQEGEPAVKSHLDSRVDAIEKDKKE